MVLTKPTDLPNWTSTTPGSIVEPGATKKAAGFTVEKPPFRFFNWFWNIVSRWLAYLDQFVTDQLVVNAQVENDAAAIVNIDSKLITVKTYYVALVGGSDTNTGLTELAPFATIDKALTMGKDFGLLYIILVDNGIHPISADYTMQNYMIVITPKVGITKSDVKFMGYHDSTNKLYCITMLNGVLSIRARKIIAEGPTDPALAWDSLHNCCILSSRGTNNVELFASEEIRHTNTAAASGHCSFVRQFSRSVVTINTINAINTNDLGYLLDQGVAKPFATINVSYYAIDYPAKLVKNGTVAKNQILSTGTIASLGAVYIAYENQRMIPYQTNSVTATTDAADIKTWVEALLNAHLRNGTIVVDVTTTLDGDGHINSINLEIKGNYALKRLPFALTYIGVANQGFFEEIQAPENANSNVLITYNS